MNGGLILAPDLGWVDLLDPVTDHPLNDGLVLWLLSLPGIDGGRQWFDLKGLNHGTLTNGPAWQGPSGRPGGWGSLRLTKASSQKVHLGASSHLSLPGVMSLSAWFYPLTASGTQVLIGSSGVSTFPIQYSLEFGRTSGRLSALASNGAVGVTGTTAVSLNTWNHAVVTRSGAAGSWTYTLYLNGAIDNANTVATAIQAADEVAVGHYGVSSSNFYFNGGLDDVRIFKDRALSAAEVRDLYDASSLGYPRQLRRVSLLPYRTDPASAPPASTYRFNPAWARQSNLILGGGVHV